MELRERIDALAEAFAASTGMLTAMGDETRQHIILEMMKMNHCDGARVGEITGKTNLSRPAVSHHLQILKRAGLIKSRKEGTKHFYYFDPETEALEQLIATLQEAKEVSRAVSAYRRDVGKEWKTLE